MCKILSSIIEGSSLVALVTIRKEQIIIDLIYYLNSSRTDRLVGKEFNCGSRELLKSSYSGMNSNFKKTI